MGGPWKDRRFDPMTWRPPAPVGAPPEPAARSGAHDRLAAIVLAYAAAVVTSLGIVLGAMKYGGW